MDIKTFRAKNHHDAMTAVRSELGEDALIISTKTINAQSLGEDVVVEIEATTDIRERVSGLPISKRFETVRAQQTNSDILSSFGSLLAANGVNSNVISNVIQHYRQEIGDNGIIDLKSLAEIIAQNIKFKTKAVNSKCLAVVGPTGVGKTTTIAKLAGKALLDRNYKVGLITIDTYRIGGAEQLCALGSVFQLPSTVVTSLDQFKSALKNYSDCDQIYIDTAGSSPIDNEKITEIKQYLQTYSGISTMLLLPASGNNSDYRRLLKAYNHIGITSIGVTKTDETCYFGPCFNILFESKFPVEVFGTGQVVPDDIEIATSKKTTEMLVRASH